MDWNVAAAKAGFSELLRQAQSVPQRVFRRQQLVAVVVDVSMFERLQENGKRSVRTLAEAAAEARAVLAGEGFELEIPARRDRDAAFGEVA